MDLTDLIDLTDLTEPSYMIDFIDLSDVTDLLADRDIYIALVFFYVCIVRICNIIK